jgi:hypothetical protein
MRLSMGKKYRNRRRRFVEYRNRECWKKKKDVTQLTMTVDKAMIMTARVINGKITMQRSLEQFYMKTKQLFSAIFST